MLYKAVEQGTFIERVNRFIARVTVGGAEYAVHVRNTGRCKEILRPGATVLLEPAAPGRKTPYTLVAVYKGEQLINIDSLAPNQLVYEGLTANAIPEVGPTDNVRREVTYGRSRFDIYFEAGARRGFIEVKGVTLEHEGVAMFPDAPTERGAKHLHELVAAAAAGYESYVFFVIQMQGVQLFKPNTATDPAFAAALRQAAASGVRVLVYDSLVTPGKTVIGSPVAVCLE